MNGDMEVSLLSVPISTLRQGQVRILCHVYLPLIVSGSAIHVATLYIYRHHVIPLIGCDHLIHSVLKW